MRITRKGSVTIMLALSMLMFLMFCLTLVEGTRVYYLRVKAEQAMELAAFSVLSEYQQELFDYYGVFFLDLDYEQGAEHIAVLEQRVSEYLEKNAGELTTERLIAKNFRRGTDCGGIPFFRQAIEQIKVKSGYKFAEELLGDVGNLTNADVDLSEILNESANAAEGLLGEYTDQEGIPQFQISLPRISFPTIDALTEAVIGNTEDLSDKVINLDERILRRDLKKGIGIKANTTLADMQLFHTYLFTYLDYYNSEHMGILNDALKYQVEYVISGKESDRKNLEDIMWRIFLSRAGGNYLFYHQDAEKMAKAEAEAITLVGVTGNAVLINLVREIFLISQAIQDGISETKQVFAGGEVPLYQNGVFSGVKLGYQEYLVIFLNTTKEMTKIYRCMDIVEMEVRKKSDCESFCFDHCTDFFEIDWSYQFQSLFKEIPFLNSKIYENAIARKIFYEM